MSGAVAKKIALFEFPVEESSRLKRKHAIKRRKNKHDTSNNSNGLTEEELSDRSRSESDVCSSCGYGTGTGEQSVSSSSRQSSPTIEDSDNPDNPENLLENENDNENEHEYKTNSNSNSPTPSYLQLEPNYQCGNNKSNLISRDSTDYQIRDQTYSESEAIVYSDSGSMSASVTEIKVRQHNSNQDNDLNVVQEEENNYCDDAFPSQSQSVLNLCNVDTENLQHDQQNSILNNSIKCLTTSQSNRNKKFKFQSIYAFNKSNVTNNKYKKAQTLKKTLFFFNSNFNPASNTSSVEKSVNNMINSDSECKLKRGSKLIKAKSETNISIPSKLKQSEHFQSAYNKNNVRQHEMESPPSFNNNSKSIRLVTSNVILAQNEEDFTDYDDDDDEANEDEPFYEEVDELRANSNSNKIQAETTEGAREKEKSAGVKKELSKIIFSQFINSSLSSSKTISATSETASTTKTTSDGNTMTSIQLNKDGYDKSNMSDKLNRNNDTWRTKKNRCRSMETLVQSLTATIRASSSKTTTKTTERKHHRLEDDETNVAAVRGFPVKDEDTPLLLSSCPPPPSSSSQSPYEESLYSEPIYGQAGSSLKSTTLTNGSSPTIFNNENESNYNGSTSSFDQTSSSIYSANSCTSPNHNYNVNYNNKTLPRPPPSNSKLSSISNSLSSTELTELPTKFSSIAKTAGRKIAKKLLSIRRNSRTSFDLDTQSGPVRRVSSPGQIQSSSSASSTCSSSDIHGNNYNRIYSSNVNGNNNTSSHKRSGSLNRSTTGEIHLHKGQRSISRPNIAPPPPPSTTVPSPQQKTLSLSPSPATKAPDLPPLNNNMSGKLKSLEFDTKSSIQPSSYNSSISNLQNDRDAHDDQPIYSNISNSPAHPSLTSNYFSSSSQKSISDRNDSLYGQQSQNHRNDENDYDDYEDSDFYDSDDLIRNFVATVQPIYSGEEEPLYQYYTYGISLKPEDDYQPVIPKNLGLTFDLLVPRVGQRTLWCELPEVISSGILGILSDKQKQLQEAIFEILTSEVSYLKSLDVLITLFYESHELQAVLSLDEMKYICGNIIEVKECSQSFLNELLKKWEESWYINEIGEIINEFALTKFQVYKEYCRNKPHQDRTLQRLRLTNDEFVSVVKSIEENPKCQLLRMDSFLMLPMQRITRLPLLVNAVIQRTQPLKEKAHCEEALKNLTNLVIDCNESARESQDAEETAAIIEKIDFPRGMKLTGPLGQFILKGDFLKNPFDQNGTGGGAQINWTFRKSKRTFYWLILFSNQLVVAKKKSSGKFEIVDVAVSADSNIKPLPNIEGLSKDFTHYFMLHFNKKETVYFLGARTQSEVQRWKTKIDSLKNAPPSTSKEDIKTLEAIFPYEARRDDELSFDVGDLLEVSTCNMKLDGWYYGKKKTGDFNQGWFPGNYCAEV